MIMYCLLNLVFVEDPVCARVHVGLSCYTSEWFYKFDAQTRNYLDVLELVDLAAQQTGKSIFLRIQEVDWGFVGGNIECIAFIKSTKRMRYLRKQRVCHFKYTSSSPNLPTKSKNRNVKVASTRTAYSLAATDTHDIV